MGRLRTYFRSPEEREKYIQERRQQAAKDLEESRRTFAQREKAIYEQYGIKPGPKTPITLEERVKLRVARYKVRRLKRIDYIRYCKSLGLFPGFVDRLRTTDLYIRFLVTLGPKCCYCGKTDEWGIRWRIALKDDPCFVLPWKLWAYEKAWREGPEKWQIWCRTCHIYLWRLTWVWLFTPYCPRRWEANRHWIEKKGWRRQDFRDEAVSERWRPLWRFVKDFYPSDDEQLYVRDFPHLWSWWYVKGERVRRPYIRHRPGPYKWRHDLQQPAEYLIEEAATYYKSLYPEADVAHWGRLDPARQVFAKRNFRSFITDDLKEFLKNNPPGGAKNTPLSV